MGRGSCHKRDLSLKPECRARQYWSTADSDITYTIAVQWVKTAHTLASRTSQPELPIGGKMDISKILEELRLEREQLGEAILSLERLATGGAKRRGRPPAWMPKIKDETINKRRPGRPTGSKNKTVTA